MKPTKKKAAKKAITKPRTVLMLRRIEDGVMFPMNYSESMWVRLQDFDIVCVEVREYDAE